MNTALFLALDILWMPRKKGYVQKTFSLGAGIDLQVQVHPMYDGEKLYNVLYDLVGLKEQDQPGIRLTQAQLHSFMLLRYIDISEGWSIEYQ